MTVPLTVRLRTSAGEQMITRQVTDLSYGTKLRGGFASAKVSFVRPLTAPPLDQFSEIAVFDRHTGEVAWEGRVDAPARKSGSSGQEVEVVALGEGMASMTDSKSPYMIVNSDLDAWKQQESSRKELNVSTGTVPGSSETGLVFKANGSVVNGDRAIAWFRDLWLARQPIGALYFFWRSGDTNRALDLRIGDEPLSISSVFGTYPWNTAAGGALFTFTPGTYPQSMAPKFSWRFVSSGLVADTTWSAITQAVVTARLLGTDRLPLPNSAYQSVPWITIDRVFTDVVARFCPRLDLSRARLDAGTFKYTQLSWPTGIDPDQVMDEVLDHEPDFTWAVWEQLPNRKWRTELTKLETEVRYEATVQDGYEAPSPGSEVYNRVAVLWRDDEGAEQVTWVTSSVPALTAAGVTRTATINLGREAGTADQAQQRGAAFLADHDVQPNGGKLSIAGPIRDRITGRMVPPWMLRAGPLIRVRGVQSTPDDLNAKSPNGTTVARIVDTHFDAGTGICDLDLDVPALTEQRLIAKLANARTRG